MNTLRKRLAGLYTATTGLLFLLVIAAFLAFSVWETRSTQIEQFRIIWDSLSLRFQSSNVFSHSFLAQTEADYHMIIHIRENGIPFLYPGSWQPETPREILIERAGKLAEQEGVFLDQAPISSAANLTSLMAINGNGKDRYYARILVIPSRSGTKSICAISYIPPIYQSLKRVILYLCLLAACGIGCLWLISWKFVGWSLKPVEENQKKQAQFIAAASHELRSPLAILRSGISALASTPPPCSIPSSSPGDGSCPAGQNSTKKDTLLPLLESECVRMARLVDDMLLLASADAKTWTMRQEKVDMDTLLIDVYEAFLPACREKEVALSLNLPDDPLPSLTGDKERLFQLFSILLDNARNFTPPGRSICILAREKRTTHTLCIQVIDEGCGIPPKLRPFVFGRFYQADSSRSDKQHFGLGLSIAKELANLHHGEITLSDGEKGGSCFAVTLPCARKD